MKMKMRIKCYRKYRHIEIETRNARFEWISEEKCPNRAEYNIRFSEQIQSSDPVSFHLTFAI
jgi:hypothetical protein